MYYPVLMCSLIFVFVLTGPFLLVSCAVKPRQNDHILEMHECSSNHVLLHLHLAYLQALA